jgi:hypothetical protein
VGAYISRGRRISDKKVMWQIGLPSGYQVPLRYDKRMFRLGDAECLGVGFGDLGVGLAQGLFS